MKIKAVLIAVVGVCLTASVKAGDYTFDLPQLAGQYLGDIPAVPTYELQVDLGMQFAHINGASLQLKGTHSLGLAGDLNSPYKLTLPAEIFAWSERSEPDRNVVVDKLLPGRDGPFEFSEPFRAQGSLGVTPDFSPWIDGIAEFNFSVYPPLVQAIYYLIDSPSVTITSATLVIQGQPNLDEFTMSGDFDGSGLIDGHDLLAWQRNPGVGLLGSWRANYGEQSLKASLAVPEPGISTILILASMISISLRRQFC
jgi:hypothetical protein